MNLLHSNSRLTSATSGFNSRYPVLGRSTQSNQLKTHPSPNPVEVSQALPVLVDFRPGQVLACLAADPAVLSPKLKCLLQRCQIRYIIQLVHVFAAAYLVHIETFQISFGVIFS